ncbi:MAG TPA: hypothetical protein VFF15_10280 [Flavobacteriaceae bacterium]|nr:hypothetical protein [Flavobacteriaceae bacterium]
MLQIILLVVAAILLTIGLVWVVDRYLPSKFKPVLIILLWVLIGYLGYATYNSINDPIKFNKIKNKRYADAIDKLIDIRDAQLAHKQVTGTFANNFDNLVKFIDTAHFTLTQRRDSSVLDVEMTKRYGVDTFKEITLIDTLGTRAVKDSLFKGSERYKTMMNVPHAVNKDEKFELQAGFIEQNDIKIPVFEAKVKKNVILHDQDKDLLIQENQVVSVDGVDGDAIVVGSMTEVSTNGNWPKNYGKAE